MYGINPFSIQTLITKLRQLREQNTYGALGPLKFLLSPTDYKRYRDFLKHPSDYHGYPILNYRGYTWLTFGGTHVLETDWVEDGVPVACVIYRGPQEVTVR